MNNDFAGPGILTHSGGYFRLDAPGLSRISITDIAHALSQLCRYTGHTKAFYSVAQHSVMVSRLVPEEHALAGLLHDASEAYIGDVSTPLKNMLPDYRAIERAVETAVLRRFGLPAALPECVRHADLVMLVTERRDLFDAASPHSGCLENIQPAVGQIKPFGRPAAAELEFLRRYYEITEGCDD